MFDMFEKKYIKVFLSKLILQFIGNIRNNRKKFGEKKLSNITKICLTYQIYNFTDIFKQKELEYIPLFASNFSVC